MSGKFKRDIFRFSGERPTAINLEHVTMMQIEGNRITFAFYTNSIFVDLENDEMAKECFEQLLTNWVSDVKVVNPEVKLEEIPGK
jgi:hypothetical protein